MRIAVFYNLNFGGAKRVVLEHVKGLNKLGHTVDVYTIGEYRDFFDPGQAADKEIRYPFILPTIDFPLVGRIIKDYYLFIRLKELHRHIAQDIDSKQYDIVLVHTDTYTQAPFILRFLKTKNVYFCLEPLRIVYEYSLQYREKTGVLNKVYEAVTRAIRKNIDQTNARAAHHTTAISYFGREYMIHAFDLYPTISYLGVDTHVFTPQPVKRKKIVFFVAENLSIYGYDLAVEAMKCIPTAIRPELKIVSWTKNNNERLSDIDLAKLYSESLVTLSLSKYDTFGLVPLESMACGTPVIALNVAGYRETMRDKKSGFLVDFSPQEIAEKIMLFLKDPTLSNTMGKTGRTWVEKQWTWTKHVKLLEKLLTAFVEE